MTAPKLTPKEEAEQARILNKRDVPGAYLFARAVPAAAVDALQEVVIARGNAFDAYFFALEVPGADILACARRIMVLNPQDKARLLGVLQKARPAVLTPEALAELSLGVTL